MKTTWKTIRLAALGVAWLAAPAGAHVNPMGERTLTVLVLDYAGASDGSLDEMETLSADLLSHAGIRTEWVHCVGHLQGPRPPLCDGNLGQGVVMLRLQVDHLGNPDKRGDPLGTSMIESRYSSIYLSPIAKYADENRLSRGCLMAYAATHEIGHLLLGPHHSPGGIMRALWGEAEYRDMAQRWLDFLPAERLALWQAMPASAERR